MLGLWVGRSVDWLAGWLAGRPGDVTRHRSLRAFLMCASVCVARPADRQIHLHLDSSSIGFSTHAIHSSHCDSIKMRNLLKHNTNSNDINGGGDGGRGKSR